MIRPQLPEYDLVLVNTPAMDYKKIKDNDQRGVPPLGLGSIATYCNKREFKVGILDAESERLTISQTINTLNETNTRYVGFNAVSENIKIAGVIAKKINHPTILGGIHPTLAPEQTIQQYPQFHFLVHGEGEKVVAEILTNVNLENISGLVYRNDGKISVNERENYLDLNSLPMMDYELFEPAKEYCMMTSRGCSYNCAFCASPVLCQRIVRFVSMEKVINEISFAYIKGFRDFHFLDDQFLISSKRSQQFVDLMKKSNLFGKITWRAMARANVIMKMSDELLKELKESGGNLFAIGIESGSERILKMCHKNISNGLVKVAVERLVKFGFRVKGFIIIGFPTETYEEMMETKNFVMELGVAGLQYFDIGIFRPYPGTEFYHILLGKGYKEEDIFYEKPLEDDEVNKRYTHGFQHELNKNILISEVPNPQVRIIAKGIIDEFQGRFGK